MSQLSPRMIALGTARSEIREAFAFAQARAAEVGPENVDDFSIGNPSVPAPPQVATLIRALTREIGPVRLHGYTPAQGDPQVRRALADDLNARFGTDYDPDCLYLTVGAAAALCCALSAMGCPGDEFITFTPCFPEYKVFVESAGGTLVAVPANIEDYLELTSSPNDADTAAAAIAEELSKEYEVYWDSRELDRAGSCIRLDASVIKGTNQMADQLQAVYILPAPDGCRIAWEHYFVTESEGFARRFGYMLDTLTLMEK